ncbi:hypothetical protein MP638_005673 [Amoeboaphelidium occidentale]|nr:hypothetical protein MP638_005673 [Amoeboaphelidium occidentale]
MTDDADFLKSLEKLDTVDDQLENALEFDCFHHFDYVMRCSALGNQINSFYRHGHGDNCKRYINNFYWCMTNAWMTEDKKKIALEQRRLETNYSEKKEFVTEGIWSLRTEPPSNFPPSVTQQEE